MNQPATLGALTALIVGVVVSFQAILSARISLADNAAATGLVMYVAGGVIAITLLVLFTNTGTLAIAPLGWLRIVQMLLGGMAGIIIVVGSAFAFAKVNPAAAVVLIIFGQMAVALIADYLGWTGQAPTPIDWRRIAGLALFAVAIWLLITPSRD